MRKEHHRYKRSLLGNFKRKGVMLIFVLFLLTSLILIYSVVVSPSVSITGFMTKDVGEEPVTFTAEMDLPVLSLKVKDVTLELDLDNSEGEFFLGDLDFNNLDNTHTVLEGYSGNINIDEFGKANIDGRASKVLINSLNVNKKDSGVNIDVNELEFALLKITDVYLKSFSFESSGNIDVGSGSLGLGEEIVEFEIRPFVGNMEISGFNLKLDGEAKDIIIKGVSE